MNLLKLEDIAIKGEGRLLGTPLDLKVKGVSIDSRTLEKGELFLALKGPYSDGHDFLKEALKRGASSFVVEKKVESNNPYILVKDSYRFLNLLAKKTREEFQGNLVGVTGSNGKTSTKEIIFSLLSAEGICHKTLGNRNNQIGVPLSLSSLNKSFLFSVIEIGTSSAGEIKNLSELVRPNIALITNATESHLEGLGSIESVVKEKGSILDSLQHDGIAILPRDSEFFNYWSKRARGRKIVSFGFHKDSQIVLRNPTADLIKNSLIFEISYDKEKIGCEMQGIGAHNALNACSAFAVAYSLGLDLRKLSRQLSEVTLPHRRLSVHKSLRNSIVIDDSYNANPDSMKRSLDVMMNIRGKKRIFIVGEMKELGEKEELLHKKICDYAYLKVDEFLCIGELWKGGLKHLHEKGKYFDSKLTLLDYLEEIIDSDCVILVKGSRSTGMDFIADKLKV